MKVQQIDGHCPLSGGILTWLSTSVVGKGTGTSCHKRQLVLNCGPIIYLHIYLHTHTYIKSIVSRYIVLLPYNAIMSSSKDFPAI